MQSDVASVGVSRGAVPGSGRLIWKLLEAKVPYMRLCSCVGAQSIEDVRENAGTKVPDEDLP